MLSGNITRVPTSIDLETEAQRGLVTCPKSIPKEYGAEI